MKSLKSSPSLRFTNFNEPWERKSLRKVSFIGRGKSKHRPRDAEFLYGGEYPFVQTGDIRNAGVYLDSYKQTYSEEGLKQSKLWNEDTLCVTIAANIAETAILKLKACFPDSIIGLVPFVEQSSALFMKYQFDNYQIGIQNLAQGVAQANLNQEKLSNIEFSFPSISEQQKIVFFLNSVDDRIQQLSKKKASLEKYKKGVMQQIFSQAIRFKDEMGDYYPDWVEHEFDNLYIFKGTNSYSRECLNYQFGSVKNIHYGDIHTKYRSLFKIAIENVPFINSNIDLNKISQDNYCREGDLVITDASEDYSGIGKCIEIVSLNNQKVVVGLHNLLARPKANVFATGFAGYMMQSTNMRRQIHRIAQGSKVLSISSTRLGKLISALPCLQEQTKIANFLSALDDKTHNVNQQLELLKQYKKGLLQQMFV
jgi:type I restriction enzyme S subunit